MYFINNKLSNVINDNFFFNYSRPVRVDRFLEHYAQMSADSDFRFSEEFEDLKHAVSSATNGTTTTTAADLPCNRPKNRFTNILPYDHSRFKLQPVDDEEGSDYINANYVPVIINLYLYTDNNESNITYYITFILYFQLYIKNIL